MTEQQATGKSPDKPAWPVPAQKQQKEKIYHTAIYCRLSKDDGSILESASIATQRDMLSRYVREQGWKLVGEYIDDGYSGVNFDRPDFKRMIADIEAGKINCVITKDLSRLGRNYLESGAYIEIYFPEHGVRYVALTDGVDTLNSMDSNMDITPFKNLLNEMYSKDLSKKVKAAIKARHLQGKFKGVSAPYGYLKDPADRNHLIIDEITAPVVRRIFDLAKQGLGIARIRHILIDEHIPRPSVFANAKGGNYDRYMDDESDRYKWSNGSVRSVLRNPVYAGHLATYKRPIPSMKSKKRLTAQPEDYLVVKNTHDPIVSQDEYDLVQRLITSRRNGKPGNMGYDNIFSGIIKCADCGYAMRTIPAHRRKKENPIDNIGYCCNRWAIYGKTECSNHLIEARELRRVVLEDIRKHADMALRDDNGLLKRVMGKLDDNTATELSSLKREYNQAEKRLSEIDRLFQKLYEDRLMEKITERNFDTLSSRFEQEQAKLDERVGYIKGRLDESRAASDNAGQWVSQIKDYAGITELTAPLLHSLIDRITVSAAVIVDGERRQTVNIYYKFIGCISE